jgi:lysophospholipase L1-like esterase
MEFRTIVDIPKPRFQIEPFEEMLFVGSCFADSIGQRFVENKFRATVNPYGTMYNPASVLHTVERFEGAPRVVFITLGTNHVYRLKETGEIVDNCQKRPAALFQEEELTVDECADYLRQTVELLCRRRPDVHVVFTVSPIRYRKYGYHESQLSKATLLLAVDKVCIGLNGLSRTSQARAVRESPCPSAAYFPAYEILMDELRDYRFYADDMLHPSSQAVAYIWQQLVAHYFSDAAKEFLREWAPLKAALNHRPFDADSEANHAFMDKTMLKVAELQKKYPTFAL